MLELKQVDALVKGRGMTIAQGKLIKADGTIKYFFSKPNLKWYDWKGWLWYFAHKRDIIKARNQENKNEKNNTNN